MVLIVTADADLAKRLLKMTPGEKSVFLQPEEPRSLVDSDEEAPALTDREKRAEDGHRWMRNNIYEHNPNVVLLDVSFGGSLYRAVDSVPRLVERGVRVILLVPFDRDELESFAITAGCFDVLSLCSRRLASELAESVSAARDASRLPRATRAGRVPKKERLH